MNCVWIYYLKWAIHFKCFEMAIYGGVLIILDGVIRGFKIKNYFYQILIIKRGF